METKKRLSFFRRIGRCLAWGVLGLAVGPAAGQEILGSASNGNPFNLSLGSARAKAMGSAFVGLADDASALWVNPAGLPTLSGPQVSAYYNQWLVDTNQEMLLFASPLKDIKSGWGLGVAYFNLGQFDDRALDGTLTGTSTADEWDLVGGYGLEARKNLWLGLSLGGHFEDLAGSNTQGFNETLGALWAVDPRLKLGASFSNLGSTGTTPDQAALRLGGSYTVRLDRDQRLVAALATEGDFGSFSFAQAGLEDRLFNTLSVRAGYQWASSDMQLEGAQGLEAGIGLAIRDFQLDYALQSFGDLGAANLVTLTYDFPEDKATSRSSRKEGRP